MGVTGDRFRHEALGVVFQVREDRLSVLLWQRAFSPFSGAWALPGGPLRSDERLGTSASRHLAAKVDIPEIAHLEQLETRSDPHRDPRERVLATAYLALVTVGAQPRLPPDTAWHPVDALPSCAFDHKSIIGSARERRPGPPELQLRDRRAWAGRPPLERNGLYVGRRRGNPAIPALG